MAMWLDSHAHLYDYDDNELRGVIEEAHSASVSIVVSTAVSIETAHIVDHQSSTFKDIFGAVGISPFDISKVSENWLSNLTSFFSNKKIIAVGEIGIDNSNPTYPPLNEQIPFFEQQLQLAKKLNLPAVIHSRGAELEALTRCQKNGIIKAVFHCFTGDRESLKKIINAGYTISLSGIITFKNAAIRELVNKIPLEQLLIETDSPYLTPVPFRGKKNTPSMVRFIGEEIAALYKKDPGFIADQINKNFMNLIGKEQVQ